MKIIRLVGAAATIATLAVYTMQTSRAAEVIYDFSNPASGAYPGGPLAMDKSGALYGVASQGGVTGNGTVFRLTHTAPGVWTETTLYSFQGGADGFGPAYSLALDSSGAVYGVTEYGSLNGACGQEPFGCPTIFKLSPPATGLTSWTKTTLATLTGQQPSAGVTVGSDGTLYGVTLRFGTPDYGTIFEVVPPARGQVVWTLNLLHQFVAEAGGWLPEGNLIVDRNGFLIGTAEAGGAPDDACGTQGCGAVFQLRPPANGHAGWTEKVLYDFKGASDGYTPRSGVIADHNGALYGTTVDGASAYGGGGSAFRLAPPTTGDGPWSVSVLHVFGPLPDARIPNGLAIDRKGNLFGASSAGGPFNPRDDGDGTVFELSPPPGGVGSWNETILLDARPHIGVYPQSILLGSDRFLYATMDFDGPSNAGTVIRLPQPAA